MILNVSVSTLKAESAIIILLVVCILLTFNFVFLSFQSIDDTFKKQMVSLAVYSIVSGVVLFACLTIYLSIKKAFSRMGDQLPPTEELMDYNQRDTEQ